MLRLGRAACKVFIAVLFVALLRCSANTHLERAFVAGGSKEAEGGRGGWGRVPTRRPLLQITISKHMNDLERQQGSLGFIFIPPPSSHRGQK